LLQLKKKTLVVADIEEGWIGTIGDLDEIAEFCKPALTFDCALGESWDPDHLHFLITAEIFDGDEVLP
jgi:hypothetical protein